MSAPRPSAPPRALRPIGSGGFAHWLRGLVGRAPPKAEVVAPPALRLGEQLELTWRLDYGARDVTNISVALVGSEVARQRISARTGISIVTDRRPFLTLEIDRRMPDRDARTADGRGAVVVPASTVPSIGGRLNEIAWAIVVEAAHQATPLWTGAFPVIVLPVA
ncbi:MAG TPA: hypothetical protein VH853_05435 [Polyangia bacterium]|jgi:hypothetical protein|nr:hypothetical protein [Polyangia bacterium]